MRIYSWNILFENKQFDVALRFIQTLDFDVLALQEVPEEFLAQLKSLPFQIAYGPDTRRVRTNEAGKRMDYLVILSKHEITRSEGILFPSEWYQRSAALQARITAHLMGWLLPYGGKGALRVELLLPQDSKMQVFCAHLAIVFSTSTHRLKEFEYMMENRNPDLPIIFCADMNILELPHITLLNWLGGGKLLHWLLWWRERNAFKKLFKKYGLKNPLKGGITHPIALSQIDHILVPEQFPVVSKKILKTKHGSDHNPVMVEVKL